MAPYEVNCFHICDYESNSKEHRKIFQGVLEEIKDIKKINKNLIYKLGYSNYSFELWIVNHKLQCINPKSDRKQYLEEINKGYNENFKSLDQYKEEKNFKKILSKITLEDVVFAIKNAEKIRKINKSSNKKQKEFGKFVYFEENPDMTIHECIKKILLESGMKDFSKN